MSVFSGQCALVKWPDSNYPLIIRGGWFQSPNEVKLRHPSHKEWTKNPHPTTLRSGKVTYMTMLTRGLFQDVLPIDFAGDFPAITIFFREKKRPSTVISLTFFPSAPGYPAHERMTRTSLHFSSSVSRWFFFSKEKKKQPTFLGRKDTTWVC